MFTHKYVPALPIIVLSVSILMINIQQFYYGRDSDEYEPWVLSEIVSYPTVILSVLSYCWAFFIGGLIPLFILIQYFLGVRWRSNSLGMALSFSGVGILWACLTKFASSIYNYVVFGSTLPFNGIFLCLVSMACLLMFTTKEKVKRWSSLTNVKTLWEKGFWRMEF